MYVRKKLTKQAALSLALAIWGFGRPPKHP